VLRVAWLGTYVQTQHDDHEATVQQGEIDLVHDQNIVNSETRFSLDAGITKQFTASLVVPVRIVGTSIRYLAKVDGSEVDLVMPGIHHRNETLVGVADPMVLGSFATPIANMRLVVRAGITLPVGSTEDNPFTPEAETLAHQHVQMGTGTVRPVFAAELSYQRRAWRFGGFGFTQQSVYENDRGYKAGDRYAAGIVVSHRVGKQWSLRGGAEVQGETAERWDGVVPTDDGNRGRFDAMISAGASYAAADRLSLDATIKVPFITEAVGGQLDMPAILEVGATWRFGAVAKKRTHDDDDHDHEHEHGEGHDHDEHGEGHDEHGEGHDEHGDEHAHGDEHGHGTPTTGNPTTGTPTTGTPTTGTPTTGTPTTGTPTTGNPTTGTPTTGTPTTGTPTTGTPTTGTPTTGTPTDKPTTDKPTTGKPTTGTPTTGTPTTGTPTTGTPTDKPTTGTPTDKPTKPAAKPDVAAYNKPGEAPDLVPVKGKLTIFDFWATWCLPCKKLDPVLVELAKKYPDLVAIRKLDVVDWDSKAAERYLTPGGFDLPHLKIFDPAGKRVLEKSSAPGKLQELIDAAKAIVEAAAKQRGR
jgi:thiol-disulfide isomerase/thioredoxin